MKDRFRQVLARSNPIVFTAVAGLAGFCAYFAMYAFRKPFTAATYGDVPGWHFAFQVHRRQGDFRDTSPA
jgi:hypothetical protein